MSTRRTHPLEWAALGFCIVSLSHTEWSLAVSAGAHPLVAAAVPGALDVYAIRAMRVRRHVPQVVLAMLTVNAMSYLVRAGVLPMSWHVLILVSAIVPLVFWAVHTLGHGEARVAADQSRVSVDEHAEQIIDVVREHTPEHVPVSSVPVPDTVPVEWSTLPSLPPVPRHVPQGFEHARHTVPAPSAPVPEPDGYVGHVPDPVPAQWFTDNRLPDARVLDDLARRAGTDTGVSIRALKEELGVGTPRAQRLKAVLDAERVNGEG